MIYMIYKPRNMYDIGPIWYINQEIYMIYLIHKPRNIYVYDIYDI